MGAQYRTINRGGHSIYEEVHKAGFDPYVELFRGTGHRIDCLSFFFWLG